MISYDKGKIQISGNAIILCYELECIIRVFRKNLVNDFGSEKDADEQLAMIMRFAKLREDKAEEAAGKENEKHKEKMTSTECDEFERMIKRLMREVLDNE